MSIHHENLLTVVSVNRREKRKIWVNCICKCGGECVLRSDHVNIKRHCGCLTHENLGSGMRTHGLCKSREYAVWAQMKERCANPKNINYENYGARGIRVCEDWNLSFEAFIKHVGMAPSKGHSIDRIDCDGNYEPGNVRWATRTEQARNTRRNVMVTAMGKTQTIADWAEQTGLPYAVIAYRIRNKWDQLLAVTKPVDMSKSFPPKERCL